MRRRAIFILVFLAGSCTLGARPAAQIEVTISAAISLKDLLEEAERAFSTREPETNLIFNFGSSGGLQRQIENGAPVDIFLSAAEGQMDALEKSGHILPGTRRRLWKNRLVLIVPKDSPERPQIKNLSEAMFRTIAIGEPTSVPAGAYAEQALRAAALYESLQRKFVLAKDVRQVLTFIETGNADAGFVYTSDAQASTRVRVTEIIPESSHAPILYSGAVVKQGRQPQAARRFLAFLASPEARRIAERFGFGIAGQEQR
jgi:molybdate transport system substrate-binding protein